MTKNFLELSLGHIKKTVSKENNLFDKLPVLINPFVNEPRGSGSNNLKGSLFVLKLIFPPLSLK